MEGYVYVISNKSMPGLMKVGLTTRSPEKRAVELSGTGSAYPATVEYSVRVPDAAAVERDAHRRLADCRVNRDREWFQCTRERAVNAVKASTGKVAKEEKDREVDERNRKLAAEKVAKDAALRRKQEDEARAAAAAREAAVKEINARYYSQFESLEKVPHFAVFWVIGGVILAVLFSVFSSRDLTFGGFVVFLLIGFIPGLLLHEWATNQKRKSPPYADMVKKRDAEYEAVNRKYPQ